MSQNGEKKKCTIYLIKEFANLKIKKEIKPYQYLSNINSFLFVYIYSHIFNLLNITKSKFKTISFLNFIIFFSFIHLSKEDNILRLNNIYEIKITVKGKGTQMILSDYSAEYDDRIVNFSNIPNEILINNVPQDYTGKYVYNLTNEYNNITMRWNNPLRDTNCMFYNIKNITFFDFSNFDTTYITEMIYMFRENAITKLNLSSFNTASVTSMSKMFDCCYYLVLLDISNFDTSLVTDFGHTFRNLHSLTSLNVENLNTENAKYMLGMFEAFHSLTSLNLKNFNTSKVISMWCMFCYSYSLKFLDLSSFNTGSVYSMQQMFKECNSLISINFKSFNTQNVHDMREMFYNCQSLISLNLNNFIIPADTNCEDMFFGINPKLIYCLDSIKNTSNNIVDKLPENNIQNCSDSCFVNAENKFLLDYNKCIDNCTKDENYRYEYNYICYESCPKRTNVISDNIYLCKDLMCEYKNKYYNYNQRECIDNIPDRYYLNDSIEKTIDECDISCKKCEVKSFCISCNTNDNYYPILNDTLNNNSFINCYNEIPFGYALEDNIYKPCYSTCVNCPKIGNKINHECSSCILGYHFNIFEKNGNCYNICEFYYYFDDIGEYHCTSEKKCPENFKLIKEKSKCIDNCTKDDIYKYEYNYTCLEFPPNETNIYSTYIDFYNADSSYFEKITENENNNNNSNKCLPLDFLTQKCKLNSSNEIDEIIEEIRNDIKNGLLNDLIKDIIENNTDLLIENDDIIFQFTSSENQDKKRYDNISIIKLGECEKLLRKENNMNEKDSLLIFKLDIKKEGYSIPLVEYEIYDYNKKIQLDLNVCGNNNNKIEILFPLSDVQNEIFKHNISSKYYNDICFSYTSEKGTDIILNDRKNEFIDKNMSLCDSNCDLIEYSKEINMSKCECEVKIKIPFIDKIVIDKQKLKRKFKDINNIMNIKLLKCYKELFTSKGLKVNIGSYIILLMIFINIICIILFLIKGLNFLLKIINKIISQNLIKSENKIINKKNNEYNIYNNNNSKNKKIENNRKKSIKRKSKVINLINIDKKEKNKTKKNQRKSIEIDKKANSPPKKNNKVKRNSFLPNISSNSKMGLKNEKTRRKSAFNTLNTQKKNEKGNYDLIKNEKNYNDSEMNNLLYEKAIKIDKRTFIEYYLSLIKQKQKIIFSFYTYTDYNSKSIKISLFIFSFALYYTIACLFFTDSTMHKIYEDSGKFNFIYQIPKILYSTIISSVINIIITYFSLTEKSIIDFKNNKNNKKDINIKREEFIKCLKIKIIVYFILNFLFLFLFWFYISCFCLVYKNTQVYLIKNTIISFSIGLLYPFGLCLLPGIFRIQALKAKNKDKTFLYNMSKILQLI